MGKQKAIKLLNVHKAALSRFRVTDLALFGATVCDAAIRIPDEIRAAHSEMPWRQITTTRNQMIRVYPGIEGNAIRSII